MTKSLDILGEESSYTTMSPKEKEYFIQLLREEIEKRKTDSMFEQVRDIIPIEDWIGSPYHVGPDYDRIYQYWKDVIVDIFREDRSQDEKINLLILSGAIGIGKSTCAELVVLRKLYEMSCYRNINAMYNLMRQASIMFFYFSVNKTQAERTGFGAIRNLIDSVPYFSEYFKRNKRIDSLLVFPENIQVAFGSGSNDMIGMNSITSILDEANFIGGREVGNAEKASALFSSIVNRSNSRFIINGGENHSLNILVSSSTSENSVTEMVIGQNRDNSHAYICAPAQWEVKPDKFSKKYFFVCKGTERLEPHVVHTTDDINNFRLSEGLQKERCVDNLGSFEDILKEIEKLPPHFQSKFLRVPEDLRSGFETNIIRSLQDMGGVSTGSTGKLFTSVSVFNDCIDDRFVHPFVSNEIVVSTGDRIEIRDFLKASFRLKHPDRPRFIHIDQSYRTDSTGIACVYVDDVLIDESTGMKKPIVGVDFMLRINPPSPPRKIAIYKIRNFIVWLGTSFGMKIGKVTYDIFNSEESRQILEEMGFNVGYQSVDRTDKAYLDLVEIMYEGRLKMYDYPILRYELFNLIHYRDKRKVDHPKIVSNDASVSVSGVGYSGKGSGQGSKDTSDALCLSGDTKLFLLSGRELTIEELYNSDFSDEWVISCDVDNNCLMPVKVESVIEKSYVPEYLVEVVLDTGDTFRVTEDHKVLMRDGMYREAGSLVEGDSLMPFITGMAKTWKDYYRTVKSPFGGKPINIYRLVGHTILEGAWNEVSERARRDNDFAVIHHIKHNKFDDRPSQLLPMTNKEHRKLHGDIFVAYNKSEKHGDDIRKAIKDGRIPGFKKMWEDEDFANKVKAAGKKTLTEYNKSEKHGGDIRRAYKEGKYSRSIERFREMGRRKEIHIKAHETKKKNGTYDREALRLGNLNRDDSIKKKQELGKVRKLYSLLKGNTDCFDHDIVSFIDIIICTKKLVDMGKLKRGFAAKRSYDLWSSLGVELYYIDESIHKDLYHYAGKVQDAKKFYDMAKEHLEGDWSRPTIASLRNAHDLLKSKGLISKSESFDKYTYEVFTLAHVNLYNHRVVSVQKVINTKPVYDLQLGSIHNFGIACGVFVHNCGAAENLLQFSIAEESGEYINRIEDFMYANRYNLDTSEFDAMTAEDLIDRQINNMIDEFEYSGDMGTGGFLDGTLSGSW